MPYNPNSTISTWGAGTYSNDPNDLGTSSWPNGMPMNTPGGPSMGFPAMAPPAISMAPSPQPRVLRNRAPVTAPLPPVRPNINVPVGQVAQSGTGSLWDALRALFSGQPSAQGQGMTGMLQSRGQAGPSTDALGNPFNRFG
jgi:hypothetical protein